MPRERGGGAARGPFERRKQAAPFAPSPGSAHERARGVNNKSGARREKKSSAAARRAGGVKRPRIAFVAGVPGRRSLAPERRQ